MTAAIANSDVAMIRMRRRSRRRTASAGVSAIRPAMLSILSYLWAARGDAGQTDRMRVHHLNCGTMAVPGMPKLVAHCLLLELDDRLALIDTGYGLGDVAQPSRLGPGRFATFPILDRAETAYEQIIALGLDPADVRDVVLTHADLDHAGGVPDFPDADIQ